jgi:hypothetical protein
MVGWGIVRGWEVVVGHGSGRIHLRLRPDASGIECPNAWAQVRRSWLERRRRTESHERNTTSASSRDEQRTHRQRPINQDGNRGFHRQGHTTPYAIQPQIHDSYADMQEVQRLPTCRERTRQRNRHCQEHQGEDRPETFLHEDMAKLLPTLLRAQRRRGDLGWRDSTHTGPSILFRSLASRRE